MGTRQQEKSEIQKQKKKKKKQRGLDPDGPDQS